MTSLLLHYDIIKTSLIKLKGVTLTHLLTDSVTMACYF